MTWRSGTTVAGLALVALVTVAAVIVAVWPPLPGPVSATTTVGPDPVSIALDARTGRVFVVNNGDHTVSVLDARSGRLVRTTVVGHGPTAVVVDVRAGRVVVTDAATSVSEQAGRVVPFLLTVGDQRGVSVLDATSGALVRTVPLDAAPLPVVAAGRDRVWVVGETDHDSVAGHDPLRLVVARSGRVVQTRVLPGITLAAALDGPARRLLLVSAAPGFGGSLGSETLTVLDAESGRVLRRLPVSRVLVGQGLAVDTTAGRAFVLGVTGAPAAGRLLVVDTRSGRLVRTVTLPGLPAAMAVDSSTGTLVVTMEGVGASTGSTGPSGVTPRPATRGGWVTLLDGRRGAIVRTVRLGVVPGAVAVDGRRARVFVASAGPVDSRGHARDWGRVSILDAHRGTLRQQVTVGLDPVALVVDERSGRAFVLNFGGTLQSGDGWGWAPAWLRSWIPLPRDSARSVPGSVSILDADG